VLNLGYIWARLLKLPTRSLVGSQGILRNIGIDSNPSWVGIPQFVRYAHIPEFPLIENEKVTEWCKFDGKEPLFVERANLKKNWDEFVRRRT